MLSDIKILNKKIKIFTTRPDTIFGATFIAISPFHPLVDEILKNDKNIDKEVKQLQSQKLNEETISKNEKVGIPTKLSIPHPFIKNKNLIIYRKLYFNGLRYGCNLWMSCS